MPTPVISNNGNRWWHRRYDRTVAYLHRILMQATGSLKNDELPVVLGPEHVSTEHHVDSRPPHLRMLRMVSIVDIQMWCSDWTAPGGPASHILPNQVLSLATLPTQKSCLCN